MYSFNKEQNMAETGKKEGRGVGCRQYTGTMWGDYWGFGVIFVGMFAQIYFGVSKNTVLFPVQGVHLSPGEFDDFLYVERRRSREPFLHSEYANSAYSGRGVS